MKQVLQSLTTGKIVVEEVPPPAVEPESLLVLNRCSAVSVGTERATIGRVRQGLLNTAISRPELVRELFQHLATEGLGPTLEKVRNRLEQPISLGYSAAGVIQEMGAGVDGFQSKDPVACAGYGYASHAELISVPKTLCVKIPEGVSWEEAAFTTLGAIALQGVRVADLKIGETVLLLGLGIVGQLLAQAATAAGCRVFGVDPRSERVAIAEELGMEGGLSSTDLQALLKTGQRFTGGRGFDAVIIAATTEQDLLPLAGELARDRGTLVVVGDVPLSVPRNRFYEKELQLRLARSYGPGRYDPAYERHGIDYPFSYVRWTAQRNMAAFLQLVAAGKIRVSPLITHRFPLDQAPQAYEWITDRPDSRLLGLVFQYEGSVPAPLSSPKSPETAKSIRPVPGTIGIGVIGAGRFAGGVLLPRLRRLPGVKLLGIATAHGATAQAAARRFRIPVATTDPRSLLKDPTVQAVVIAAPDSQHAPMVLETLRSGRHLFVEKPLCLTEEELKEIAAAVQLLEILPVLSVGFNRRFSPLAGNIKEWLSRVRQGPVTVLYRVNAGPGGRILGELGHFIDLISFFIGAAPVQVSSTAPRSEPGQPGEESLVTTLTFADGSLGTIAYLTSGDRACPKERVELFANGTAAVLDDFRSVAFYEEGRRRITRRPSQEKGFQQELAAFVRAIQTGGSSPIPFSELYNTTLATFKALESLRSGRSVPIESLPDAKR